MNRTGKWKNTYLSILGLLAASVASASATFPTIDIPLPETLFHLKEQDVLALKHEADTAVGQERLVYEKKIMQSPSFQRPIRVRLLVRDLISMTALPEADRFSEFKKIIQKNKDLYLYFSEPNSLKNALSEADLSGTSPRIEKIVEQISKIKQSLTNSIQEKKSQQKFIEKTFIAITEEMNRAIAEIKFSEYPAFKEFTKPGAIDLSEAPPELQNFFRDLFKNYFDELELEDKRGILKSYLTLRAKSPPGMQAAGVLSACGPVVQKIFQQFCELSTDPYIREGGAALRESTPVFANAKELTVQRLGVPITEYFQVFQSTPLAKASIGQVHLAFLHNDEAVVVKLLTPGIKEKAIREISAIKRSVSSPSAQSLILRMEELVLEETDLLKENFYGRIMKEIYYKPNKNIFPIGPVTSIPPKHDIIVLDKARGKSLASLAYSDNIKDLKIRGNAILNLLNLWFDKALETGYFHADFHPGNIFYHLDPKGQMVLHPIDPGAFGFMTVTERQGLMQLVGGMAIHSPESILNSFDYITKWKEGQREKMGLELMNVKFKDRPVSDVFSEVFNIVLKNEVDLPASFLKFNRGRSFLEIEMGKINKKILSLNKSSKNIFSTEPIYSNVISKHLWKELPLQLIGLKKADASYLNKDQIYKLWLNHRELILEEKKVREQNKKLLSCLENNL